MCIWLVLFLTRPFVTIFSLDRLLHHHLPPISYINPFWLYVLHHCLEVGKLNNLCLIVLAEVSQVGITTDDIIRANGICQCKKIEILWVTDSGLELPQLQ